jgi:hypothetical protein
MSFQQEDGVCFIDFGSVSEYSKFDDEVVYVLVALFEFFDLNSGYLGGVSKREGMYKFLFEFVPISCVVVVNQGVFPFLGKETSYPSFHFGGGYYNFVVGCFHVVEFQVKLHNSPPIGEVGPFSGEDSGISDESCIWVGCFNYGYCLFLGVLSFRFVSFRFCHL